jgi:hypothetical protein
MGWGSIIVVIVIVLIVAALWAFRKGTPMAGSAGPGPVRSAWGPANANPGEIAALRKNLRMKALGNEALVDRLVQAERDRRPGASESECYRAAIESWERDNR